MNYQEIDKDWNNEKKNILNGRLCCQAATFASLFINRVAIVAHSVRTGGSRHPGRAALPHKNIQEVIQCGEKQRNKHESSLSR